MNLLNYSDKNLIYVEKEKCKSKERSLGYGNVDLMKKNRFINVYDDIYDDQREVFVSNCKICNNDGNLLENTRSLTFIPEIRTICH